MPNGEFEIDAGSAFISATAFMTIIQRGLQGVPQGLDDLFIGEVVNEPITIYDLNENQLFYDFPVVLNAQRLGTIRVAATRLLGHPWIAIHQALPYDAVRALERATDYLALNMPGSQIVDSKPVCHLYPSVGLFIRLRLVNGDQVIYIFDDEDPEHPLIEVPEGGVETGPDQVEGASAFSLLGSLPEGGPSTADFDRIDQLLDAMISEFQRSQPERIIRRESLDAQGIKEICLWNAKNQPERFGTGNITESIERPEGENAERILSVGHLPQEGQVFCVIACIQMIAGFYSVGPLPSQSDMAQQLQEPPPALFTPNSGILPSLQANAFRRFLPADYQVTFDGSPTWQEFVDEIDAGRPFKSGITAHARVAIGYQIMRIGPTDGSDGVLQRSLWINDPARGSGIMLEPHEIAELDPANLMSVVAVRPRIPFKNNLIRVQRG